MSGSSSTPEKGADVDLENLVSSEFAGVYGIRCLTTVVIGKLLV
jgi:hypothetical protein